MKNILKRLFLLEGGKREKYSMVPLLKYTRRFGLLRGKGGEGSTVTSYGTQKAFLCWSGGGEY